MSPKFLSSNKLIESLMKMKTIEYKYPIRIIYCIKFQYES